MKNSTRIILGLALGALSAVLLTFAFQPYSIWPLAFIAFIPLLMAEYRVLPLRWAGLAPGIAIGGWLAIFLTSLFGVNQVTWIFLAVAGLIALGGILSAPAIRKFHDRTGYRWFLLQGAFDAAGIEMIRSFIPPIHTHAFWAQTMYAQPWMLQGISVFSIYGLTVVVMLVNFALALGCIIAFDRKWQLDERPEVNRKSVLQWMTVAGAAFALWVGFGLITLAGVPKDEPTIRVAAIQHGYAKPGHQDPDSQVERLAVLTEQTRRAAEQGARFVVWPELGLGFDPQVEHTAELQALAAETNAYILIGYGVVTPADEWRNEAVMLTPSGKFMAVYGKNFASSPGEPRIVTAGSYPVYETELGNLGTIICNDVNFTVTTRTLAKNGARLIALPTFEPFAPGLGWEQRTQAVLRAVENHVSLVKAESAGISMIVDPLGRIVAQVNLPEGVANALVADVPLGTGDTLYTKFLGDWMGWVSLAGLVVFSLVINRKKTQRSSKSISAPAPV
jgi:apolipoprotein N-acyltransferase